MKLKLCLILCLFLFLFQFCDKKNTMETQDLPSPDELGAEKSFNETSNNDSDRVDELFKEIRHFGYVEKDYETALEKIRITENDYKPSDEQKKVLSNMKDVFTKKLNEGKTNTNKINIEKTDKDNLKENINSKTNDIETNSKDDKNDSKKEKTVNKTNEDKVDLFSDNPPKTDVSEKSFSKKRLKITVSKRKRIKNESVNNSLDLIFTEKSLKDILEEPISIENLDVNNNSNNGVKFKYKRKKPSRKSLNPFLSYELKSKNNNLKYKKSIIKKINFISQDMSESDSDDAVIKDPENDKYTYDSKKFKQITEKMVVTLFNKVKNRKYDATDQEFPGKRKSIDVDRIDDKDIVGDKDTDKQKDRKGELEDRKEKVDKAKEKAVDKLKEKSDELSKLKDEAKTATGDRLKDLIKRQKEIAAEIRKLKEEIARLEREQKELERLINIEKNKNIGDDGNRITSDPDKGKGDDGNRITSDPDKGKGDDGNRITSDPDKGKGDDGNRITSDPDKGKGDDGNRITSDPDKGKGDDGNRITSDPDKGKGDDGNRITSDPDKGKGDDGNRITRGPDERKDDDGKKTSDNKDIKGKSNTKEIFGNLPDDASNEDKRKEVDRLKKEAGKEIVDKSKELDKIREEAKTAKGDRLKELLKRQKEINDEISKLKDKIAMLENEQKKLDDLIALEKSGKGTNLDDKRKDKIADTDKKGEAGDTARKDDRRDDKIAKDTGKDDKRDSLKERLGKDPDINKLRNEDKKIGEEKEKIAKELDDKGKKLSKIREEAKTAKGDRLKELLKRQKEINDEISKLKDKIAMLENEQKEIDRLIAEAGKKGTNNKNRIASRNEGNDDRKDTTNRDNNSDTKGKSGVDRDNDKKESVLDKDINNKTLKERIGENPKKEDIEREKKNIEDTAKIANKEINDKLKELDRIKEESKTAKGDRLRELLNRQKEINDEINRLKGLIAKLEEEQKELNRLIAEEEGVKIADKGDGKLPSNGEDENGRSNTKEILDDKAVPKSYLTDKEKKELADSKNRKDVAKELEEKVEKDKDTTKKEITKKEKELNKIKEEMKTAPPDRLAKLIERQKKLNADLAELKKKLAMLEEKQKEIARLIAEEESNINKIKDNTNRRNDGNIADAGRGDRTGIDRRTDNRGDRFDNNATNRKDEAKRREQRLRELIRSLEDIDIEYFELRLEGKIKAKKADDYNEFEM